MITFSSYPNERSSWIAIASATTTVAVLGLSSFWFYQLVQNYGFDGALRFLWEGDPNPEHIRDHVRTLNTAAKALNTQQKTISVFEEGLERARLDTIDDSDASSILVLWRKNLPSSLLDLRKHLAKLSYDLDRLAATVDQVPTDEEIRQQKKQLSKRVVFLMERADALIAFFKSATDESANATHIQS
jgi:hypothetical protein